jgi:hypothetical protein
VEHEIRDLLIRKATPRGFLDADRNEMEGTIYESDLHLAISSAPLEKAHRIISPLGDIQLERNGEMVVFGSVRLAQ